MQYCTYYLYACAGLSIADISPLLIFIISLITKSYKYRSKNYQMKNQQNQKLLQSKSYRLYQGGLFSALGVVLLSSILCLVFTINTEEEQWINQISFMLSIIYWVMMIIIIYKEQRNIGGISKYILWNWCWNLFWFISASIYIHLSYSAVYYGILISRCIYVISAFFLIHFANVLRRKKVLARKLIKQQQEEQLIKDINYFKQQKLIKQQIKQEMNQPLLASYENAYQSNGYKVDGQGVEIDVSSNTSNKTEKIKNQSDQISDNNDSILAKRKTSVNQSDKDTDCDVHQQSDQADDDLKPIKREISEIIIKGWDVAERFNRQTIIFIIQYFYQGKYRTTSRSLREFQALFNNLKQNYPNELFPSFPEKSETDNLDTKTVNRRKKKLQQLLEFIAIRNLVDDYVLSFLEEYKKQSQSLSNSQISKKYTTIDEPPTKIIEEASSIESNIQKNNINFSLTNSDL